MPQRSGGLVAAFEVGGVYVLGLDGRDVADGGEESSVVVPVDPISAPAIRRRARPRRSPSWPSSGAARIDPRATAPSSRGTQGCHLASPRHARARARSCMRIGSGFGRGDARRTLEPGAARSPRVPRTTGNVPTRPAPRRPDGQVACRRTSGITAIPPASITDRPGRVLARAPRGERRPEPDLIRADRNRRSPGR